MAYGIDSAGCQYVCDGMYFNIYAIVSQEEEDAREAALQEDQLEKHRLRLKLTKHLSRFEDNEKVLLQGHKFLLREHKEKLIKRYIRIEALPAPYAVVVTQKDAVQLLVGEYFRNTVGFPLDFYEQSTINSLAIKLSENQAKDTAYSRVADLRRCIFDIIDKEENNKQLNLPINSEDTRQLLSACRLSLLINDYISKSTSYQLEVREKTMQAFAYEMSMPFEHATMPNGKKYIPRWKARHLHTLDYYAYAEVGKGLKRLESVDRGKNVIEYIIDIVEVCLDY